MSGDVHFIDSTWGDLSARTVSGEVEATGDAGESTDLHTISGEIFLGVDGVSEDYVLDLDSVSGDVRTYNERLIESVARDRTITARSISA